MPSKMWGACRNRFPELWNTDRVDLRTARGLTAEDRALWNAARKAAGSAYAPYSRFHVGAALLTDKGAIWTGCNVENASYGMTICAERNAIFGAVSLEGRRMRIRRLAVFGDAYTVSPCGACRQVISEFAGPEVGVLFPHGRAIALASVDELLPFAFSSSELPE